jgi:hypothetical protein
VVRVGHAELPVHLRRPEGVELHAEAVKKMKGFDRAAAVSQQLRMWEWLFTRPSSVLDAEEPPALFHLGAAGGGRGRGAAS